MAILRSSLIRGRPLLKPAYLLASVFDLFEGIPDFDASGLGESEAGKIAGSLRPLAPSHRRLLFLSYPSLSDQPAFFIEGPDVNDPLVNDNLGLQFLDIEFLLEIIPSLTFSLGCFGRTASGTFVIL